jgi:hypothetical protein
MLQDMGGTSLPIRPDARRDARSRTAYLGLIGEWDCECNRRGAGNDARLNDLQSGVQRWQTLRLWWQAFGRLSCSDWRRDPLVCMHAVLSALLLLLLSVARVILHHAARYVGDRCTMAK